VLEGLKAGVVGLGWTPNDNVSWNIGYSHIAIDTPTVNDISATGSTLVGKYSANANLFGVSGTFSFGHAPEPVTVAAAPPPPPAPAPAPAPPTCPEGQTLGADGSCQSPPPAPAPEPPPKPFRG